MLKEKKLMNKHTKLAVLIAPFLILGGYIASDFYIEHKASKERVFLLAPQANCDVINHDCVLTSGELEVSVYDEGGVTKLNSTFPLDTAILFLVDKQNNVSSYSLGMNKSPYYWERSTPLRNLTKATGSAYKLRLIATIKGGKYIAEFDTHTLK